MTDGWIMDAFGDGSDLPDDFGADLAPPGMRHVGSQPPYGFDGCGWLAGVDTYVRAEDYDRRIAYTPDDYHLFADIARLTAELNEARAALSDEVRRHEITNQALGDVIAAYDRDA